MTFRDQRIVILGGSSGIGLATAGAVADEGGAAVVVSSTPARVDAALALLPDNAEGRVADLTDEAAIRALFAELGSFDHLVYTAGEALQLGPLDETSVADAARALEVRVWGAYAAVKYGHGSIRPGGSIVLSSGTAGPRPSAGWTVGAMICSAMEGLTRALAVELAPLRVNAVRPGLVRTTLWDSLDPTVREGMYEASAAALPVGRIGEATDVAETFTHLMRNGYTTGTVVTIDGGALLV